MAYTALADLNTPCAGGATFHEEMIFRCISILHLSPQDSMPIVSIDDFTARQFDYLVLGGGTAGLTVANRLAEDKGVEVGIIEAGGHDTNVPEINVPGLLGRTIANATYDWSFLSVPQPNAGGRRVLLPRGKGLGGSSLLNFMGMVRPSKEELDALEDLGNNGWNWASMLEYMKKSESYQPCSLSREDAKKYAVAPQSEYHGTSGPIKKSFPAIWPEQLVYLLDACEELGVPRNGEMGNGINVGAATIFGSVDSRTSKRSYATDYFESSVSEKLNLHVLLNTHVCKVVLEMGTNGIQKAVGVEIVHAGRKIVLDNIADEIILSAGSFQTPQLLELSGIGNPEILEKHGIVPIINLPGVGENLQDHICVPTIAEIRSDILTMDVLSDPTQRAKHEELYRQNDGLLSSLPSPASIFLPTGRLGSPKDIRQWQRGADVAAFAQLNNTESLQLRSGLQKQYDLQRTWLHREHLAHGQILNFMGHSTTPHSKPEPGKRYTTMVSVLLHPLSRGTVHIASADPFAPPDIDPNFFSNEADLELLLRIVQFTIKVLEATPMAKIVCGYTLPAASTMKQKEEREQNLRGYIRNISQTVYHPVGTAAMLPLADGGVVDNELRVYGTSNLRVVDLSILPMEVSCNVQSLAYAIGEKAADIFKRET